MSKPEMTPEIEDVLSSIRRLVSGQAPEVDDPFLADDDDAPLDDLQPDPEEALATILEDLKPPSDALVLSPAQRLPDADRDTSTDDTPADPKDHALWKRVGSTLSDADPSAFEADDPAPVVNWTSASSAGLDLSAETGIPAFVRALQTSGFSSTPRQQRARSDEPEDILRKEFNQSKQSNEPWPPVMDDAEMAAALQIDPAPAPVAEPETSTPDPVPEPETTKEIAESPELQGSVVIDPWSDEDQFDAPAEYALDTVAQEVTETAIERIAQAQGAAPTPTATPPAAAPSGSSAQREEAALAFDRDALHDLVSEIVREELQGALGERITRNVRKLVRREVHRALTSRDFD